MKLLRYGPVGQEKPGMLDSNGDLRDLSGVVDDIAGAVLSDDGMAKLRAIDPATMPPKRVLLFLRIRSYS
jgi:ureidoglycolate lyase